jgi:signal transduction histidine kinase
MNFYALSSSIASLFSIGLAIAIVIAGNRTKEVVIFSIASFLIGCWSSFPLVTTLIVNPSSQHIAAQVIYIFAAFVPFFFWFLFFIAMELREKRDHQVLGVVLLLAFLFAFISFHPHYIEGVISQKYFRAVIPGPLFGFFVLYFGAIGFYGSYRMLAQYRKSIGTLKNKYKYLFIGFGTAYFGGLLHFIAAYTRTEPIPHDLFVIVFVGVLAYAILTKRLMDIDLALRDWAVSAISASFTGLAFWAIGFSSLAVHPYAVSLSMVVLTALLTPIVFPWLKKNLQQVARGEKYFYLAELERIADDLYRRANLSEMLKILVADLASRARLIWAGVWLYDLTKGAYALQQAAGISRNDDVPKSIWTAYFGKRNPVIQLFESRRELIVTEDVRDDFSDSVGQAELQNYGISAAMPMYSENKLIGFIGFGQKLSKEMFHQADIAGITELGLKAERAVGQAHMLFEQSNMISKLAHDLKNFVNSLGIALEKILEGGELNSIQKNHLFIAWDQKNLIKENICDLLEMERLVMLRMQGKWRVQRFNLTQVAQDSLTAYASMAEAKAIVMEPDFDGEARALGDPRVVRRALDNLLINALKFTPGNGRIKLTVRKAGKNIRVTVKDNGHGITPEDLPRIFDPLFQGKNQTISEGTGLGLALVKEVAMIHKGSVKVDSGLGEGATFTLELPSVERKDEFAESLVEMDAADFAA